MNIKSMFRKIHFIKIYDFNYNNAGDIFCSPFIWFHDFFKSYSCISHCLSSVRYEQISKDDVVIIGGGGIINYNPWFNFNIAINKILSLCDNVILWGAGFNTDLKDGKIPQFNPEIDFGRFRLYGIRDYNLNGYNYVPCASCMNPLIKMAYETKPQFGLASMLHPLMKTVSLPGISNNLSHFNNITTIMEFISSHEVIITNSYHCALWAMLANRKVVSPKGILNGNKFTYLRHKPAFCADWENEKLLNEAIESAINYPVFLEESVKETEVFFEKVKDIVSEVIPIPDKSFEAFYTQNQMAEYYWKLRKI